MKRSLLQKYRLKFLLAVVLMMTLAACGHEGPEANSGGSPVGGTSSSAAVKNVECTSDAIPVDMVSATFNPYNREAPATSIIKWTNHDSSSHRVTSDETPDGGFFESDYIPKGSYVCFKFTAAGVYNYHCSDHMAGIITITTTTL